MPAMADWNDIANIDAMRKRQSILNAADFMVTPVVFRLNPRPRTGCEVHRTIAQCLATRNGFRKRRDDPKATVIRSSRSGGFGRIKPRLTTSRQERPEVRAF